MHESTNTTPPEPVLTRMSIGSYLFIHFHVEEFAETMLQAVQVTGKQPPASNFDKLQQLLRSQSIEKTITDCDHSKKYDDPRWRTSISSESRSEVLRRRKGSWFKPATTVHLYGTVASSGEIESITSYTILGCTFGTNNAIDYRACSATNRCTGFPRR
jgi:hypothetical protein